MLQKIGKVANAVSACADQP